MKSLFLFFQKNKTQSAIFAIIWTLLILGACLIPGNEVPNVKVPLIDKWVHFVIFAGFAFLWLCVFKNPTRRSGWVVFILSVLLGYGVELLQDSGITTGRSFDWFDVVADAIGGMLGVILFFAMFQIFVVRKNT